MRKRGAKQNKKNNNNFPLCWAVVPSEMARGEKNFLFRDNDPKKWSKLVSMLFVGWMR